MLKNPIYKTEQFFLAENVSWIAVNIYMAVGRRLIMPAYWHFFVCAALSVSVRESFASQTSASNKLRFLLPSGWHHRRIFFFLWMQMRSERRRATHHNPFTRVIGTHWLCSLPSIESI